jgi:glutamate-1-semialdehyde 2,1-aminomutase
LPSSAFISDAQGVTVTDLDGNSYYDIAGSYGVNVFGHDFYVQNMRSAVEQAAPLGMTLGAYHPVVASNAKRLAAISGMDEVSFHMSGTEAVMQAVRLARYHTKRTHLVRFCGAYHGWWGDVQPGIGNPQVARETYTLKDMDADSLHVLRTRKDIACVLVNPIQALHPNGNSPSDGQLVNSSRSASFNKDAYAAWLIELRSVCTERGIALIFDEVFLGFRLAKRGAQEYFGIEADLVTYGKTLGGGFPVGVLCGKQRWMQRFRPERPVDVCFARGTFNSHPAVMTAMDGFLRYVETDEAAQIYASADSTWNRRASHLNESLEASKLPVRVAHLQSVFCVFYTSPARYNWLFQYYLRDQGLALSWVGTGRFVFSLNYTEAEFEEVAERIVRAASLMQRDGFWWQAADVSNKSISRALLRELWERGVRRARPGPAVPDTAVAAED